MTRKAEKLSNFLSINRKYFQHPFWKERRTFSKAEAWLWLIAEVRFDAAAANELIGGKMIRWNRGEIPASLRYLAEAWNWEKNQVDRFLKLLEKEAMILRRLDQGQTIIRLINYGNYNSLGQQMGQQKANTVSISGEQQDSKWDSDGTATGQTSDKTNIVNIENIENKKSLAGGDGISPEEKLFEGFKQWILKYAPRVSEMKEPFTLTQYVEMRKKIDKEKVSELLIQMHNWEPLKKKNRSAYLTLLNWKKMSDQRQGVTSNTNGPEPKKMVV
jgi:hypothetical protein